MRKWANLAIVVSGLALVGFGVKIVYLQSAGYYRVVSPTKENGTSLPTMTRATPLSRRYGFEEAPHRSILASWRPLSLLCRPPRSSCGWMCEGNRPHGSKWTTSTLLSITPPCPTGYSTKASCTLHSMADDSSCSGQIVPPSKPLISLSIGFWPGKIVNVPGRMYSPEAVLGTTDGEEAARPTLRPAGWLEVDGSSNLEE